MTTVTQYITKAAQHYNKRPKLVLISLAILIPFVAYYLNLSSYDDLSRYVRYMSFSSSKIGAPVIAWFMTLSTISTLVVAYKKVK